MADLSLELRFTALMQEVDALRGRLDARGAASQLAFSSFDSGPGHGIDETDPETGNPVASFGTQFDGSHGAIPYSGPIPPVPTGFTLEAAPAVLSTVWPGQFDGGDGIVTMDWTHAEVHASQDANFTAEFADTIVGTINTPRGGKVTAVVGPGTWYVRLVSRSAAGKRSAASEVLSIVVEPTVDVAPIEADLAAAEAAIAAAKAKADQAFADAGIAQGTASSAASAAAAANTAAGTAQTTANNAASAASAAQGTATAAQTAAGNAQTTANTANTAAGTAQTAANNALKKFTVSTNVPSGTSNNGDVWWRKDANGAIIGQWEYQTASPAGWKVRTTDGGIITNMAVSNLVAGSGTMSSAVIDKLFSDVVVARMAVATEFIGTNAILTNAITAPKIVASEQLSAKVAEFLTVNANNVNTNSLWADTAWLAAARSHILQVMQYTNGEGYTSTVTGQGLKVTRTENGETVELIRLGTFGEDFLGISDGTGKARAVITGAGDIGGQSIYSEDDVYSNGRLLALDQEPGLQGQMVQAQHPFTTAWTTISTTGAGLIEVQFMARRGRAYRLHLSIENSATTAVPEIGCFQAGFSLGLTVPTIANVASNLILPQVQRIYHSRLSTPLTMSATGRFIPLPASTTGSAQEILCRVLIYGFRAISNGTLNVHNVHASIEDAGRANSSTLYATSAGTGTSTVPASENQDVTYPATEVRSFRRAAGTTNNFTYDSTNTTHVIQGRHGAWDYLSFVSFTNARNPFISALTQQITSSKITMTPDYVKKGLGAVNLSTHMSGTMAQTTLTSLTQYPFSALTIGAWGQGVTRSIELKNQQQDMLRQSNAVLAFGVELAAADYANERYSLRIPISSMNIRTKFFTRI